MFGTEMLLGLALVLGPYSAATNHATDLEGDPDSREGTWGTAGAVSHRIVFKPPVGYRVRVLRVYGDFLTWPIGKVESGKFAGTLWGLQTTGPDGSARADPIADNCFLYIQLATGGEPARASVNYDVREGGLLGPDHILVSKHAVWLNDTGLKIHMESSFVLVYQFEKEQ